MATILTGDCPRCGARKITFDVEAANEAPKQGWRHVKELFSICRHCRRSSIILVVQIDREMDQFFKLDIVEHWRNRSLNEIAEIAGYVSIADNATRLRPEHVSGIIGQTYDEACRCEAIGCYNAASAMFRTCLDLLTKPMLPPDGQPPANKVRRSLGLRLQWLFDNNCLPVDLRGEAEAVQLDGNDGVHDASLTKADAADLGDFTDIILERLVTNPAKLTLAAERRAQRRT